MNLISNLCPVTTYYSSPYETPKGALAPLIIVGDIMISYVAIGKNFES